MSLPKAVCRSLRTREAKSICSYGKGSGRAQREGPGRRAGKRRRFIYGEREGLRGIGQDTVLGRQDD